MAIKYDNNNISVDLPKKNEKDIIVYSHPNDNIKFNFDLSSVQTEVTNGDLVLYTLSGQKITIANFALMTVDGSAPNVTDISNKEYNAFDFLQAKGYMVDEDMSKYVISREVVTPDSATSSGDILASGKVQTNEDGASKKETGNYDVTEQNIIPTYGSLYDDYLLETLLHSDQKDYESMISFKTKDTNEEDRRYQDTYPVKLRILNPKMEPYYGTSYTLTDREGTSYQNLNVDNGNGLLLGSDYAYYMYDPYVVDVSGNQAPVYLTPNNSTTIERNVKISVSNAATVFTEATISGLPSGVKVVSNDPNITVKPVGSGSYELVSQGAVGSFNITLEYNVGMPDAFTAVSVSIEGYNSQTLDIVRGSSLFYADFKPVNSASDILNYSSFNTFTFSTQLDPLEYHLTGYDDHVEGGSANSTYYTLDGGDTAYSGSGSEKFDLGDGNDTFFVGEGADTVNGGAGVDNLDLSQLLKDHPNATVEASGTGISVSDSSFVGQGTMTNFENVLFDENDNTLYIKDTRNFTADINVDMKKGNDTISGEATSITVDVQNSKITETGSNYGVVYSNAEFIKGSSANDVVIGASGASINFDGQGGEDTVNFSGTTYDITFDAASGTLSKGNSFNDTYKNVENINTGSGTDLFYGAFGTSINYDGGNGTDTLSYQNLQPASGITEGVTIDFNEGTVTKGDGTKDTFDNMEEYVASDLDDTYIVGAGDNTFNGLEGFNTLDYSSLSVGIIVDTESGTVKKGGQTAGSGTDKITNFQGFIATNQNDTFILTGVTEFTVDGKGGTNSVDYSNVEDQTLAVTLGTDISVEKTGNGVDVTDTLTNVQSLTLGSQNDTIYSTSVDDFNKYAINGGDGSDTWSFENSNNPVNFDFNTINTSSIVSVENLELSNYDDTIKLANEMFVTSIDGLAGDNTVDMTQTSIEVDATFNLFVEEIATISTGSSNLTFSNINNFILSNANDTIDIAYDSIGDEKYSFNGSGGFNTLDFTQVADSNGLRIDISGGKVTTNNADATEIMDFSNFQSFVGTSNDDIFVLPDDASSVLINGGEGSDIVSYLSKTTGINFSQEQLGNFTSIEGVEGSNFNDTFSLNGETNLIVVGADGMDTISYGGLDGSVVVDVNDASEYITVTKGANVDQISEVEYFNFAHTVGSFNVEIDVSEDDNSQFGVQDLYFEASTLGTNTTSIDYSGVTTGVSLYLNPLDNTAVFGENWLQITKANGTSDYIKNISDITLSAGDDTVYFYTNLNSDVINNTTLTIDGGAGSNTLSFENYLSNITVNVADTSISVNDIEVDFTQFYNFVGTNIIGFVDTFQSSGPSGFSFDGMQGTNILDYSTTTSSLDVTLNSDEDIQITDGTNSDSAKNITNFVTGTGDDSFTINSNVTYSVDIDGGAGSDTLEYDTNGETSAQSIFYIDQGRVVRDVNTQQTDTFTNVENFIAGSGNDTFYVSDSGSGYSFDGGEGGDTLNYSTSGTGLTFDFEDAGVVTVEGSATAENFENFIGSSHDDTFSITQNFIDTSVADGGSLTISIKGYQSVIGGASDTLDLSGVTDDLKINPVNSTIIDDKADASDYTINTSIMNNITLGSGDDTYYVGVNSNNWEMVDGGTGTNTLSFANQAQSIYYNIASGSAGGSGSSVQVQNFTAIGGSGVADTFYLEAGDEDYQATTISGEDGRDTLDYSALDVEITVDMQHKTVQRGSVTDTINTVEIFKSGAADATFISSNDTSYEYYGQSGFDNTLSYAGMDEGLVFDFANSKVQKINSAQTDKYSNIDHFIGGSGNDVFLFASSALTSDTITIDGGDGTDTINFSNLEQGFIYDSGTETVTTDAAAGTITITLSNVENLIGSSFDDTFIMANGEDGFVFNGGVELDSTASNTVDLSALGGSTVSVSGGTIQYSGGSGTFNNIEHFIGSDTGNDTFEDVDSKKAYTFEGQGGTDTLDYSSSSVAISITFDGSTVHVTKGSIEDTFTSIEVLKMSGFSDTITLNSAADLATLSSAFDQIDGGNGNDKIIINSDGSDIKIDFSALTIAWDGTSYTLNTTGFESYKTGSGDDIVKFAAAGVQGVTDIDLGAGSDTVDLSAITTGTVGLTFDDITEDNQELSGTVADQNNATAKFSGVNQFTLASSGTYNMVFNTIDATSMSTGVSFTGGGTNTTGLSVFINNLVAPDGTTETVTQNQYSLAMDGVFNFTNFKFNSFTIDNSNMNYDWQLTTGNVFTNPSGDTVSVTTSGTFKLDLDATVAVNFNINSNNSMSLTNSQNGGNTEETYIIDASSVTVDLAQNSIVTFNTLDTPVTQINFAEPASNGNVNLDFRQLTDLSSGIEFVYNGLADQAVYSDGQEVLTTTNVTFIKGSQGDDTFDIESFTTISGQNLKLDDSYKTDNDTILINTDNVNGSGTDTGTGAGQPYLKVDHAGITVKDDNNVTDIINFGNIENFVFTGSSHNIWFEPDSDSGGSWGSFNIVTFDPDAAASSYNVALSLASLAQGSFGVNVDMTTDGAHLNGVVEYAGGSFTVNNMVTKTDGFGNYGTNYTDWSFSLTASNDTITFGASDTNYQGRFSVYSNGGVDTAYVDSSFIDSTGGPIDIVSGADSNSGTGTRMIISRGDTNANVDQGMIDFVGFTNLHITGSVDYIYYEPDDRSNNNVYIDEEVDQSTLDISDISTFHRSVDTLQSTINEGSTLTVVAYQTKNEVDITKPSVQGNRTDTFTNFDRYNFDSKHVTMDFYGLDGNTPAYFLLDGTGGLANDGDTVSFANVGASQTTYYFRFGTAADGSGGRTSGTIFVQNEAGDETYAIVDGADNVTLTSGDDVVDGFVTNSGIETLDASYGFDTFDASNIWTTTTNLDYTFNGTGFQLDVLSTGANAIVQFNNFEEITTYAGGSTNPQTTVFHYSGQAVTSDANYNRFYTIVDGDSSSVAGTSSEASKEVLDITGTQGVDIVIDGSTLYAQAQYDTTPSPTLAFQDLCVDEIDIHGTTSIYLNAPLDLSFTDNNITIKINEYSGTTTNWLIADTGSNYTVAHNGDDYVFTLTTGQTLTLDVTTNVSATNNVIEIDSMEEAKEYGLDEDAAKYYQDDSAVDENGNKIESDTISKDTYENQNNDTAYWDKFSTNLENTFASNSSTSNNDKVSSSSSNTSSEADKEDESKVTTVHDDNTKTNHYTSHAVDTHSIINSGSSHVEHTSEESSEKSNLSHSHSHSFDKHEVGDFDLGKLLSLAKEKGSGADFKEDISHMHNISEESIHATFNHDEANSISYALDYDSNHNHNADDNNDSQKHSKEKSTIIHH